jgi:hypothetical protein
MPPLLRLPMKNNSNALKALGQQWRLLSQIVVRTLLPFALRPLKMAMTILLNGEKIYVTSGARADSVVVWATLDKNIGRAAIKSFVVKHGTEGMQVTRLEKKSALKPPTPQQLPLLIAVFLRLIC